MTHRHTLFIYIALLLALTCLAACQEQPYHTAHRDLPRHQWDHRDTLSFPIPPADTDTTLTLTIGLRAAQPVATKEIKADLQVLRDGHPVSHIPLTFSLFNDKDALVGTGLPIVEVQQHLHPFPLKAHHQYTLRLTHRMRLNPIDHIHSIDIHLQQPELTKLTN